MNPSSFRVNGRNAEEEAMMADALRAVFGQGAAVHRGAIGTPLGEEGKHIKYSYPDRSPFCSFHYYSYTAPALSSVVSSTWRPL